MDEVGEKQIPLKPEGFGNVKLDITLPDVTRHCIDH